MYEYKVVVAKGAEKAEEIMNEMAQDGWRVIANTFIFANFTYTYTITFEKEK